MSLDTDYRLPWCVTNGEGDLIHWVASEAKVREKAEALAQRHLGTKFFILRQAGTVIATPAAIPVTWE